MKGCRQLAPPTRRCAVPTALLMLSPGQRTMRVQDSIIGLVLACLSHPAASASSMDHQFAQQSTSTACGPSTRSRLRPAQNFNCCALCLPSQQEPSSHHSAISHLALSPCYHHQECLCTLVEISMCRMGRTCHAKLPMLPANGEHGHSSSTVTYLLRHHSHMTFD
jgi:hypothetical protein